VPVAEEMLLDNDVATAVICLWAEAKEDLVNELKSAAESEGLRFHSPWTWEEGKDGFYSFDQIAGLRDVACSVTHDESSLEADHLQLASLWLSRAISPAEESVEEAEEAAAPGNGERPAEVVVSGEEEEPEAMGPATDDLLRVEETATYPDSLDSLRSELAKLSQEFQRGEEDALVAAQAALTAVKSSNLQVAAERAEELRHRLSACQAQAKLLRRMVKRAVLRLREEAAIRPDLRIEFGRDPGLSPGILDEHRLSESVDAVLDDLRRIREYNEQWQEALSELDNVRAATARILADISHWMPGDPSTTRDTLESPQRARMTLSAARELLRAAETRKEGLEDEQTHLRQLSRNRITNLIERLEELGFPIDQAVWNDQSVAQILSRDLERFSSTELARLEEVLVAQVEERALAVSSPEPQELAAQLQGDWDDETLLQLLECLAEDKRDVQAFLLVMGATAALTGSHRFGFKRPVVSSLLRGVGRLSQKTHPFQLLSALAPEFLDGWEPVDVHSEAELRLVFTAAHYAGDGLPDEFLWRFAQGEWNWPIEEMHGWDSVWQLALQGKTPSLSDEAEESQLADDMEEARSQVSQTFAREGGRYVRLNSIRNPHYANMLRAEVMPWLQEQLDTLQKLEADLQESEQNRRLQIVKRLEALVAGELVDDLGQESLEEKYDAATLSAGIHDAESFHRETALRVMEDCADSILVYGRSLLSFWRTKMKQRSAVSVHKLRAELECIPDLSPLGQAALDTIIRGARAGSEHQEQGAPRSGEWQVAEQLLSQSVFASSMPRLVGHLARTRFAWPELLDPLLEDIAAPVDPGEASRLLLECGAPDQVLLMRERIAGDIAERAEDVRREKEQELNEIEERLLEVGGNIEDLQEDRVLGRWALVYRQSTARMQEVQEASEADREAKRQQADAIMQAMLNLERELFGVRDVIPPEVYQVIDDGLTLAKKAVREARWLERVDDYLNEIRYLLKHETWPLPRVTQAYKRLEASITQESYEESALTIEELLELLEARDLEPLRLSGLAPSKNDTRVNLLHNWLSVRGFSAFRSEDLGSLERGTIKNLFRYFAQMVAMRRVLDPDGNPVAYEHPVVFSHWRLQHYKVEALRRNCVFVALPGDPPRRRDFDAFEDVLEKRDWLDVFYVVLFAPGITPKQCDRLRTTYNRQGLVILHGTAILEMVMAEAESSKPLWRLRPIMLNSTGKAEGVFQTNNSIDFMSGIFAGRDDVIRRIAFSPNDYALYGGRRIGKSSVLNEVRRQLDRHQDVAAVYVDYQGKTVLPDDRAATLVAQELAKETDFDEDVQGVDDFEDKLRHYLDNVTDLNLVLLIDEVDYYIRANSDRHVFIECLRGLSERYRSRFRVIIAGFMELYDCTLARGPSRPSSDPWSRMLDRTVSPLPNLRVKRQ
jgi:hypothetical protein